MATSFLDRLDVADRDALLALLRPRAFVRGDVIFRSGEEGSLFGILLSGRTKVVAHGPSERSILIDLQGPGDLIGELSVLTGEPRSADVIAVEPVRVGIAPALTLRRLAERPNVSLALLATLGERLRDANSGRWEIATLTAEQRVGVRLLQLVDRYGRTDETGTRIELPISQDELADWTGLSRPAVARVLAQLRGEGLVTTARRSLSVLDSDALRALFGR
ncbi:MAG: Crp/Fnr family transcriptional regulator [Jatrophihabitans sp.]|uniref:Crp/Fnr family transcriptional regulator n=1 Tax=Jatrophihabitans sp. TaxID=1932789 RepID=UPI0039100B67